METKCTKSSKYDGRLRGSSLGLGLVLSRPPGVSKEEYTEISYIINSDFNDQGEPILQVLSLGLSLGAGPDLGNEEIPSRRQENLPH